MCGGSKVVQTPYENKGVQEVKLPDYVEKGGQKAVDIATKITETPFTRYGGKMVADLNTNQKGAIDQAAATLKTGEDSIGVGKGALGAAGALAGATAGQQSGAMNGAGALAGIAANSAIANKNAGKRNSRAASGGALSGLGFASENMDAGVDSGYDAQALAREAGNMALENSNAGAADLDAARGYTAKSASDITAEDIRNYMNPYVSEAIDPVAKKLAVANAQQTNANKMKSAMSGSFGGSRTGIQEAASAQSYLDGLQGLYGEGYSKAFDNASKMATDSRTRNATAAGLSIDTAGAANTQGNDAVSRLVSASGASGAAGKTMSDLKSSALDRINAASKTNMDAASSADALANSSQARELAGSKGLMDVAKTNSDINSADVSRLLSVSGAANASGASESALATEGINRLLATGALQQGNEQAILGADYQQFLLEQGWPREQLAAMVSAVSGIPIGTTTTQNSSGFGSQVVQTPSMFGQIAGGLGAAASLMSDRDSKENIKSLNDEDTLKKLRRLESYSYNYKPEAREKIGDDGRERIGPMAQDVARELGGDGKTIAMPVALGSLFSAVRGLEKRTAKLADKKPKKKKAKSSGALPRAA